MTKRRRYIPVPQPSQKKTEKTLEKTRKVDSALVKLNLILTTLFIVSAAIVLFSDADQKGHDVAHVILGLLASTFMQNAQSFFAYAKKWTQKIKKK